MADTLSSQSITNLDANPIVANTAGVGARGEICSNDDFVTPTALGLQATASKYKLVRLPPYVKVKELILSADARPDTGTTLAVDVGAYWSDSTTDGTPASLQGTLISVNCFGANVAFNAAFQSIHVDGALTNAMHNQPLWQALGLAAGPTGAPPVGFIDVVLAVHTAATTGVSTPIGIFVRSVW